MESHLRHQTTLEYTPKLFRLSSSKDREELLNLFNTGKISQVTDTYTNQLTELFEIQHPQEAHSSSFQKKFTSHLAVLSADRPLWQQGVWVFFPWKNALTHLLEDNDFQQVRWSRNRHLIFPEEQRRFYKQTVAIGGLSVGNSVATSLVLSGGAQRLKLADFDILSLSNCNRIRTSIDSIGLPKVLVTARQIYEMNPYSSIDIFPDGLNENNIDEFLNEADVIVDELDNLGIKFLLRQKAREKKIPLLMGTDNGDNCVIGIERHDLQPTPFFHGALGEMSYEDLSKLKKFEVGKLAARIVGFENISSRMFHSLDELGRTLVSWPQLGNAATVNGAAISYCIRRIANGQTLPSQRAHISLDLPVLAEDEIIKEKNKQRAAINRFQENL